MYFSYPQFLESTPEFGFAAAVTRLSRVATLVKRVKSIGPKRLTYQDCKEVTPLYVAAQNELEMVDRRSLEAMRTYSLRRGATPRLAFKTDGCWVLMACVHDTFVEPYQAAKRYIFIPFDYQNNKELKDWAKDWQAYYNKAKQKNFEIIEYSSTGKPFTDIPLLSQIYILGHSSAGSDTISAAPGKFAYKILCTGLADRMRGLSTEFWGKIKVYACSGGAESATSQAFADKFAKAMRDKGYVNCEYFGYTVPLAAPSTFDLFEGRLTSTLDLDDKNQLVQMARGSETIKDKLFSPEFRAKLDGCLSSEAKLLLLRNALMMWVSMEKEKKPSGLRRQF